MKVVLRCTPEQARTLRRLLAQAVRDDLYGNGTRYETRDAQELLEQLDQPPTERTER